MYRKGDLEVCVERPTEDSPRELDFPSADWRSGKRTRAVKVPVAFLPHSCGQWIIGGPKEIRALIVDLRMALLAMGAKEA